jgi:nucleotide-binding universal stress UspA family protein
VINRGGKSHREVDSRGRVRCDAIVESGQPAAAIARIAESDGADIICIASQGRSRLPRILLGAVAQELLLSSRIPLLVVPPPRE